MDHNKEEPQEFEDKLTSFWLGKTRGKPKSFNAEPDISPSFEKNKKNHRMKLFKFTGRDIINKVPEVTIFFWIIKILCTTVGETASDFLSTNLNWGLTTTTLVTATILIIILFFQFRSRKYVPGIYWLAVVFISVVGTQITDNLSDNLGVSLLTTTIVFAVALAIIFAIWYSIEKTLSIHSINTLGREAFY